MNKFLVLVWDNLKNSLRTKRALIFLALYLVVFGLITYAFFQIQNEIEKQLAEQDISGFQREFMTNFAQNAIVNGANNNAVVQFLFKVPPLNIVLFLVSLVGTPILLFILNYDKVSQEIYDGTIRYLLFRASRWQIFFAKFVSSLIECAGITLIALFMGVSWASVKFQSVDFALSLQYGLRYWFIAQFFLLVFVAYSLMTSAIFKKPFTSLVVSFVGWIVMIVVPFFVSYIPPYDPKFFEGLFFHNSLELIFSLMIYLLFTAVFLAGGYQIFKRNDL